MSSYMYDIGVLYTKATTKIAEHDTQKSSNTLDMTDFLQLMVVQLQSQTIDNTADTSDMLNQLVQMQMVTALTNMTDASVMSYAGSMVGKEVTVAELVDGKLQERVVTITGTGTSNGEQVVFAGNETFKLSDIMAIGRLPEIEEIEDDGAGEEGDTDETVEGAGSTESGGSSTENSGSNLESGDVQGAVGR